MKRMNLMFRITADYRPKNPNKPHHYVYAESSKEARERFRQLIPWLTIYEVEELSYEEAAEVSRNADLHPERYSIW